MKILHTSDWHLGRILHGCSLLEDQLYMLKQIAEEMKNGYDALIVAGDIFDRAVPPATAMTLLNDFFKQIITLKIPVIMIPGNHDSTERLNYGASLFEQHNIYICCMYDRFKPVVIKGNAGEELDIFTMPFVDHAYVNDLLPDAEVNNKETAVLALLEKMKPFQRETVPSVLVAHEFIAGSEESESERIFIGGSHVVRASLFSDYTYVALGHLHKFQKAEQSHIHYCGSPLPYSFGEVNNKQGISSVSITKAGVSIKQIPITPKRKLVVLEDTFDQLINNTKYDRHTGDYVSARITDNEYNFNLQAQLRERFSHLLEMRLMAVEKRLEENAEMTGTASDNPSDVFGAFLDYFQWGNGEERKEAEALFETACEDTRKKEAVQ